MRIGRTISALATILLLVGCGGRGANLQTDSSSRLSFAIEWPTSSRFIHQSATHIVVSAKVNGVPIALAGTPDQDANSNTLTIVRPNQSQSLTSSQVAMTGLPSGPVTFTVESFRIGEDRALGKATVPVVLVPGDNPNLDFVLESQSSHVEVVLTPQSEVYEEGQTVIYSARSVQGAKIVVEGPGEFTFSSSEPSVVQLMGNGVARLLRAGSSLITAREVGNDLAGKSGQREVIVEKLPITRWSVQEMDFSLSTLNWVQVNGSAFASGGSQLIQVDPNGRVTFQSITGFTNLGWGTFGIIGIGPNEEIYVKYNLDNEKYHIYRIGDDFHANLVFDGFVHDNRYITAINRSGLYGARIELENGIYDFKVGQPGALRSANIVGQAPGANFHLLDNGGAIVTAQTLERSSASEYVANFGIDTTGVRIMPPPGHAGVHIAWVSQEGYWKGVATNGENNGRIVFGRFGSLTYARDAMGVNWDSNMSSSGMIAHSVWINNALSSWDLFDSQSSSVSRIEVIGSGVNDYKLDFVLSPNLMVGTKGLNFAVFRRVP